MDEFVGRMFGHCFTCKTAEMKDVYIHVDSLIVINSE